MVSPFTSRLPSALKAAPLCWCVRSENVSESSLKSLAMIAGSSPPRPSSSILVIEALAGASKSK